MRNRFRSMFFVILAGETIFMLPFVIPRLYRPLMLEAWKFTNTDFGTAFAAYGVTAMISYLLGGPLADKYHPRFLISISLAITALGSLYLLAFPSVFNLILTYGFFGFSTIFFMWGALIKTTHLAGGEKQRSFAMGILDGGRGLAAAVFASLLVYVVSIFTPDVSTHSEQLRAVQVIYILTVAFSLFVCAGVWTSLKDFKTNESDESEGQWDYHQTLKCLQDSRVWMLSLVVLSAYCGYKGIDNYVIYLVNVHGVELAQASMLTSLIFWLRPISALAVGFLADKFHSRNRSGRFIVLMLLLLLSGLFQLLLAFTESAEFYYYMTIILSSAAFAYALRAVYFSVFGDLKIPTNLVGTTTGIVSFVGFLPDIFFGWVTGRLIDANPGFQGFKLSFLFICLCLFVGTGASVILYYQNKKTI